MFKFAKLFSLLFIFLSFFNVANSQTVVTVGGGTTVTCPAVPTATWTTPPSGVTFSNWSRGTGVLCKSSTTALTGNGFNSTTAAIGYSVGDYYKVTITAGPYHNFNMSNIVWNTSVQGGGGATFEVMYSNNGGALTSFGVAGISTTSNPFSGSVTVTSGTSLDVFLIAYNTGTKKTIAWENGSTITVTATCVNNVWLGTSTNYLLAANWSCAVPTATTNGTIPSGLSNYPIITTGQTALANNLTIAAGGSLTVNNTGILQLSGAITNAGTVDISAGTLELAGTSAQTISGSTFSNRSIKNLTISNTASLSATANDTLKVSGFLSFGNVNSKTFNTNGNLTLASSSSGTASLKDITNAGVNSGNAVSGNVSVQRYISSGRKFRFVSMNTLAGTGSTNTINANWMEGQAAGTSTGTGYGIWITGTGGTTNNFDAATLNGSMKYWDTTSQNYMFVTNPSSFNIRSQAAYMTYIRGDRSATGSNALVPSTVLRTYGTLTQGTTSAVNIALTGVTAIGNPYASAIDLSKLNFTSANNIIITVWDPLGGGAYTLGNFKTLTKVAGGTNFFMSTGGGSYPTQSNFIMNTIESGQAFYVQGNTKHETVQFTEASKTPALYQVFFSTGAEQIISGTLSINEAGVFTIMDGTQCRMRENYNTDVDFDDAIKLTNTSENVSIKRGTTLMAVEFRNVPNMDDTVQLNMTGMRVKTYQWKFEISNMDYPGRTAYLKDQFTGINTPLDLAGTNLIDFSVTSAAGSYAPDRFMIIMNQPAVVLPVTFTTISANRQVDGSNLIKWQSGNEINIAHYETERSAKGISFTSLGSSDATNNAGGIASYSYADNKPLSGDNYYRIKAVSTNGRVQYSAIVKLSSSAKDAGISVNPNPASGGIINVYFENEPTGKYSINLINEAGQKVSAQYADVTGNNMVKQLKVQGIAAGTYRLSITGPEGKRETKQVVIQ